MNEFLDGARLLGRGWGWWHRRPGTMAAGLVPAFVVGVLMVVALGALLLNLGPVGDWLTPFADDWVPLWERGAELAAQAIVLAAALVVVVVTFTALTLAVGEPFYDRIWRTVEQDSTGTVPEGSTGIWRGAVDGLALVTRGLVVAVLTGVLGLLPLVGTVVGWATGVLLTGWLLTHELTSRALTARGIDRRERTALLRAHRARALGFGMATQLCFLVPAGAVATMPAAVAGSTLLAQSLVTPRPALTPPAAPHPATGPSPGAGLVRPG